MVTLALGFADVAIGLVYLVIIALAGAASIQWWSREEA